MVRQSKQRCPCFQDWISETHHQSRGESREGSGLRVHVLLNPSSHCSLHDRQMNLRDEMMRPGRDFIWKAS